MTQTSSARVAEAYQLGKAELSDYLIGAKSQASGAAPTYTFDRKLRDQDGFTLLQLSDMP